MFRSVTLRRQAIPRKRILRQWRQSHSLAPKQQFSCLDLRQSGLSVIERLCLEECLLRHDSHNRQWIIWGTHHPTKSRFLQIPTQSLPSYIITPPPQAEQNNPPCIVVMGIGGKPKLLLDIPRIQEHGIWVVKRFSGGGTVVVDHNCIYTTLIGRNGPDQLVEASEAADENSNNNIQKVPPYPREIMEWTATNVFGPTFAKLKEMAASTAITTTAEIPDFELKENDYVMGGTQKVAGNAQSIVKTGFLHHTSFLWTFRQENMKYLKLPAKRPEYRKDRSHASFLIELQEAYHNQLQMDAFFQSLEAVCQDSFDVEHVTLDEAMLEFGTDGIQGFFESKSRTRFVDLPR
ncbi:Lipoate-protein ligase [Seminavis robusta]|uniref:Lipoate-protein ligase n=1 Tax=Seminavis robusta TaxID=568900 RepID=A0A9N8EDU9_9STRA|nr:Lipoate-protein ligase [Seminavis robusta]|eukprot:Sro851_g210880.1 Lipoate-protein ligase (348) ;mRNA; r:26818-27861